jgi:hypothetical protein
MPMRETIPSARVLPPDSGPPVEVELRSAHTDTHVYLLASWKDDTENLPHKTWTWSAEKNAYVEVGK